MILKQKHLKPKPNLTIFLGHESWSNLEREEKDVLILDILQDIKSDKTKRLLWLFFLC